MSLGLTLGEEDVPPRRSKASLLTSSRIPNRGVDLNAPWDAVVLSVLMVGVWMVNAETHGAANIAAIAMLSFISR